MQKAGDLKSANIRNRIGAWASNLQSQTGFFRRRICKEVGSRSAPSRPENEFGYGGRRGALRRSRGTGDFDTVLRYADLPQVRAWRACAQLDSAAVFDVRKPESVVPVLL
jgi:hypothetical protein